MVGATAWVAPLGRSISTALALVSVRLMLSTVTFGLRVSSRQALKLSAVTAMAITTNPVDKRCLGLSWNDFEGADISFPLVEAT